MPTLVIQLIIFHSPFLFQFANAGSLGHVTDAEVEASYKICKDIKKAFGCGIASISVDNAGSCVAGKTAEKLGTEGPVKDRDQVLACRDGTHTIDLMPKDLMKTPKIEGVMNEGKAVYTFFTPHRVNSIRSDMVRDGTIDEATTVKNVVETRMNLTEIQMSSACT